jgi:hypothetical protein
LIRVIRKRPEKNVSASLASHFPRSIGAATIDKNNFVGDRAGGLEQPRQVFLFVLGDDAHAQPIHLRHSQYPRQYLMGQNLEVSRRMPDEENANARSKEPETGVKKKHPGVG